MPVSMRRTSTGFVLLLCSSIIHGLRVCLRVQEALLHRVAVVKHRFVRALLAPAGTWKKVSSVAEEVSGTFSSTCARVFLC